QGEFVLTLVDGNYSPREIPPDPLGKLIDLNIVSRGEGGNITALEIIGEKGSYLIKKEYNIRFLLRPVQYIQGRSPVLLHRIDGSVLENYSIMPSAFFYCQLTRDQAGDIQKVTFRGGGNGHGVGMSQWGAFGMSQLGHSFESILKHYYPKIELWSIYAW
ncbi:MAG TPA: stage II sporulation protein SpoIID, partial [Firmicutes bacterium]|nr:stage II sporulation protein SpoIID [Bacillota bacterium]